MECSLLRWSPGPAQHQIVDLHLRHGTAALFIELFDATTTLKTHTADTPLSYIFVTYYCISTTEIYRAAGRSANVSTHF